MCTYSLFAVIICIKSAFQFNGGHSGKAAESSCYIFRSTSLSPAPALAEVEPFVNGCLVIWAGYSKATGCAPSHVPCESLTTETLVFYLC